MHSMWFYYVRDESVTHIIKPHKITCVVYLWSGKRGSNPRPSRWQRDALSTELFPQQVKHYYNNKNNNKSQGHILKK